MIVTFSSGVNPIKSSKDGTDPKATPHAAEAATLYLVATPIGNLGDISHRAVALLGACDVLLAEDTRHTRKLLAHYNIAARPSALHEHNEQQASPRIIERLVQGASVALVSDAGTPAISDPGYRLVRAAVEAGVSVVPVPGASAPLAALVASGLPTDRFCFVGFPPRKQGARQRFFEELCDAPGTLLLLESPRRVHATLVTAAAVLGPKRRAVVAREMTKKHEEFLRGTLETLVQRLAGTSVRGEVTVCIGAAITSPDAAPEPAPSQIMARYEALLSGGSRRRDALRTLAKETGMHRRDVYRVLLERGDDTTTETDGEDLI